MLLIAVMVAQQPPPARRDDARRAQSDVCGCRRRRKARLGAEFFGREAEQKLALSLVETVFSKPQP
jgi:hypothetical protein